MKTGENPFDVLGVSIDSSFEQISAAWKEKAKRLHPDLHPNVEPEVRAKLTDQMARVNNAYQLLKDDLAGMQRTFRDFSNGEGQTEGTSATTSRHQRPRNVPPPGCLTCGSITTEKFTFKRQVGKLFWRDVATLEGEFCKPCAQSIGRSFQSRTLTTGWWGTISVFANMAYVLSNSNQLFRANKMLDPEAPPGYRISPLEPGKPVLQRRFSWIGPIILAVITIMAINNSNQQNKNLDFEVGVCVVGYSKVSTISCQKPHNGKIISMKYSESLCPVAADSYVEANGRVYCIDGSL